MIKILVVNNKFKHFEPAKEFFEKLLKPHKVEILQLPPSKKDFPSNIDEETKKILEVIQKNPSYFKVLLSITGVQLTSPQFASQIIKKHPNILFVIGGAWGVNEQLLKDQIDLKLSLSKFTLNHILATIVLLEQIYRSFDILKGGSYHH